MSYFDSLKFKKIRNLVLGLIIVVGIGCIEYFAFQNLLNKNEEAKFVKYDLNKFSLDDSYNLYLNNNYIQMSSSPDKEGYCIQSNTIALPDGDYIFSIVYTSESTNKVIIQGNNDVADEYELSPYQNIIYLPVTFEVPTTDAKMRFYYCGEGTFSIMDVNIVSNKMIYTDHIFSFILLNIFLLIIGATIFGLYKKKISYKDVLIVGALIILALLTIPQKVLTEETVRRGVDTIFHLTRIEEIRDGLLEGQFPVVIWPYMANEYGEIATAYPSTFLYFAALLRILRVSPIYVFQLMTVFTSILQLTLCYLATKIISGDKIKALIASVLFAFSLFHIDNLGNKGTALGMGIAAAFTFLVVAGIYQVLNGNCDKWYILTLGMTGVINAHILTAVFCTTLVMILCLLNLKSFMEKKRLLSFAKAVLASVLINLYIILSFADGMRNDLNINNLKWTSFGVDNINLAECVTYPASLMTIAGLIIIFMYIVFNSNEENSNEVKFLKYIFGICFLVYLLTTNLIPWQKVREVGIIDLILNFIQYPTRLYAIITPLLVIGLALCIKETLTKRKVLGIVFGIILVVSFGASVKYANDRTNKDEIIMYNKVIGETHVTPPLADYLPNGVTKEWYDSPVPVYSNYDDGIINIVDYKKLGTRVYCTYTCKNEKEYMDIPLFFYKGYICYDSHGNKIPIEKGKYSRIRLNLMKTDAPYSIYIKYDIPIIYYFALAVSVAAFVLLVIGVIRKRRNIMLCA